MSEKEFEVGDLVEWYEPYADGFAIKDAGKGIILEKSKFDFSFVSKNEYTNYKVFRNKHSDTMYFESRELQKIEEYS
jgi:hypothetical protein